MGRGNFEGEAAADCKVLKHSLVICAKMAEMMVMPFGLWAETGPRNHKLGGVQFPHGKGQFWGKGAPIVNGWHSSVNPLTTN